MSHLPDRLSLKRTLGISTVLHLLLAPLFITSAAIGLVGRGAAGGSGAMETSRVSYVSIQHRPPAAHRAAATERSMPKLTRPTAAKPRARVVAQKSSIRPSHPNRLAADTGASGSPRTSATIGRIAISIATAAPEQAAPPIATPEPERIAPREASPVPTATATPSAAPPQVADATARGSDAPPGAWGQSFDKPLVADETALTDLRSRYHARAAITIEVDDSGHATHVTLPGGMADDVRAELERRLRELHYVPAECNGLRCGGTLQITI